MLYAFLRKINFAQHFSVQKCVGFFFEISLPHRIDNKNTNTPTLPENMENFTKCVVQIE